MRKMWPLGIIIGVWLLFSFPYWGKGLIPFPSSYLVTFFAPWSSMYGMPVKNNAMPDVITQIYPWKRVTIDAWKHGELPLWNPYSFSGTSHVGNYQSAVFSPVNALFFLLPEIHAWSIMILLQPILAGLFMFLFLRSLAISKQGSVIGSLAFMFCGFIVVWMAYGTLGYAVLFLPLILCGMHTFVVYGYPWAGVLSAAALSVSFLSGHFQMSVYVLLYTMSFLIYLSVRAKEKRRVWIIGVLILLGVSVAAMQLLPAFDSYMRSVRSSMFSKGEVIPWQYLVTIFSPDFYGNPVTRNDWFGHYAEWASFLGVVPLALAFLALGKKRNEGVVRYFAVMTIVPLFLAFQTPFLEVLYALHIPVLSTSSASRIIILVSFSLAALSGFGMDALRTLWQKREWKTIARWCLWIAALAAAVWAILLLRRPFPADKLVIAMRNMYLPTFMAGAVIGIALLGRIVPKRYLMILPFFLLVLTAFDTYRFAAKWMPFDRQELVYPPLPVLTKLQSLTAVDHTRVFGNIGNEAGSAFGILLIEGYDAVYQHRYGRLMGAATQGQLRSAERSVVTLDKRGAYSEDMLQLLGVRYYVHKKSDGRFTWAYPYWEIPHYVRIWEDEHFEILENTASLPRTFLASSYRIAASEQDILDRLFMHDTDRRETLILEQKPQLEPQPGGGIATIASYRPNEVIIKTDAPVSKLLFLSDVYDAGWRASVDGKPAAVYRADFDFRAVSVPAGTHIVRMWYQPVSISTGFVISGFATLGLLGFYLWKRNG